jgi:hypothetical protein
MKLVVITYLNKYYYGKKDNKTLDIIKNDILRKYHIYELVLSLYLTS